MARRLPPLLTVGWTCLLLVGLLGRPAVQAQDRGAPRFGPAAPGDTVVAEASDAGRVWSLAAPPLDRFATRYDMAPDSAWATHLRRGLLRLPDCTAALVSASGLALTTASCVREHLENEPEMPLVAEERDDERRLSNVHADRLLRATDVTAAVRAARQDTGTTQALQAVERRLQSDAGANRRVEVGGTAAGPPYTAYTYRRHRDVRVAFLPERAVSEFGGVAAAMTYPRHALDVAVLRVYTEGGSPLSTEHFFEPSTQGVRPGDPVFAAGRAQPTRRAESAEQLALRRDLMLPARRAWLETWTRALRAHLDTTEAGLPEQTRRRAAERALKRTRARLQALDNEYVQTRLRRRDAQLRRALRQDPALQKQFGGLIDSVATVQEAKRELASAYRAFGRVGAGEYGSATYRRMLAARQQGAAAGSGHTAGDTRSASVDSTWQRPAPVETALLAHRLDALRQHLRPDTAAVRRVFQGRTPSQLARTILETSVLAAPTRASSGGATPVVPPDDPATPVVEVVRSQGHAFRDNWRALTGPERRLTRRLARARRAVRTVPVQSAGDMGLRLTDGRVQGYPYNGTLAPPFTTFFGLYEQAHAFEGEGPWALPDRWRRPSETLNRSAPLVLAASTDGIVSNNGAPLLNKYLEFVGVATGPNIQGVAGDYLFLPERMRTVGVDLRGLRQALTAVYGAEGLASELFGRRSTAAPGSQQ